RRRVGLPETDRVAFRVLPGDEPAHAGNRLGVVRLAAELLDVGSAGVNVVDIEIDADRAWITREQAPAGVFREPGPVVLDRPCHRLELPAEQVLVELLGAAGVLGSDLDVHGLAWHQLLLSRERRVRVAR